MNPTYTTKEDLYEGCGGALAERKEGFFGQRETAVAPMNDAPTALEFAFAKRQRDEGLLLQFLGRNPPSDDAHAQAKFDEFLDGFHAAEFNDGVEDHLFSAEVLLDEPEGVALFIVEDVILLRNFIACGLASRRPGMLGPDDESEFVGKERMKIEREILPRMDNSVGVA